LQRNILQGKESISFNQRRSRICGSCSSFKGNKYLQTMEQLRKASQEINAPIIVSNQVIDLNQEHEIIVEWKINHTLLQDKLMSCKYYKHINSFSVIFLMLSLVMLST
jgi:hypothetical protein